MVAISLYRGNLHRVPSEVPRRFISPTPKISLHHFRRLLQRRNSSLSLLQKQDHPKVQGDVGLEEKIDGDGEKIDGNLLDDKSTEVSKDRLRVYTEMCQDQQRPPRILPISAVFISKTTKVDTLSDMEKRKKEIEEKLEVLNAKKHDLVQVLKHILSREEELKSRNSPQGMGARPSVPLHVDVTNDYGSFNRLTTPRLNSDGNLASDIEKGEAGENSPHNTQSCPIARTNPFSPSSDSRHRRPASSAVPNPRGSLGGIGSPSRFGPVGHPTNISTAVSTSGTGYIASSPSPAGSGGTSAFRDNRQSSPWN